MCFFTGKLVEYPLDTIKTVSQFDSTIKGPVDCCKRLGFSGLYRGVGLPLVASVLELGTIWSTTKAISRYLQSITPGNGTPLWHSFAGGAISGFIITHILTPAELIKVRMQTGGYTSTLQCIRQSIKADGVGVLFRGYGATLAREIPGTSIWIGVYEALVHEAANRGKAREDLSNAEIIAFGSVAGMLYWALPFPVDTVKTSMQAGATPRSGAVPGFIETAQSLYARGGVGAFYRGLAPSIVRAAPASAAILFCSELTQRSLDNVFPPHATTVQEWQSDDSRIQREDSGHGSAKGGQRAATGSAPSRSQRSPEHQNSMAVLEPADLLQQGMRAALNASSMWSLWFTDASPNKSKNKNDDSESPWRGAR